MRMITNWVIAKPFINAIYKLFRGISSRDFTTIVDYTPHTKAYKSIHTYKNSLGITVNIYDVLTIKTQENKQSIEHFCTNHTPNLRIPLICWFELRTIRGFYLSSKKKDRKFAWLVELLLKWAICLKLILRCLPVTSFRSLLENVLLTEVRFLAKRVFSSLVSLLLAMMSWENRRLENKPCKLRRLLLRFRLQVIAFFVLELQSEFSGISFNFRRLKKKNVSPVNVRLSP